MIGEMCSVSACPVGEGTTGKPGRQTGNMVLREIVRVLFLKVSPHSPPLKKGGPGGFSGCDEGITGLCSIVASSSVYAR